MVSRKTLFLHGWKISTNWQILWKKKKCFLHEKAHAVGATTKQIKQFSIGLLEREAKKSELLGSYWKKALEFAKKMGIKKFKASDCCVNKWKKRCEHNNSFLFAFFYTALKIFTKNFHHFS